jgi:glycerol transport system ATP-binding protein
MCEGRITQFGPTISVYRNPADLVSAQTFADPPLNTVDVQKSNDMFIRNGAPFLQVPAHLAGIADGVITVAFQPHHLSLTAHSQSSPVVQAHVIVSEIAGSESFIHVESAGNRWVMLEHGIHDIDAGSLVDVFIDTKHLMAFDTDGRSLGVHSAKAT